MVTTRGSSTGCPPSSLRSLHTMSISGTMQERRHDKTDTCGTLTRYEGGHEALRHGGLQRRRSHCRADTPPASTCGVPEVLIHFCAGSNSGARCVGRRSSTDVARESHAEVWKCYASSCFGTSSFLLSIRCSWHLRLSVLPILGFPVRHTTDWDG